MSPCIQRPELAEFIKGNIGEPRAEQISQHIDDCPACQDTVVGLSDVEDTFLDEIRQLPTSSGPEQRENAFRHGLQRLLAGMQQQPVTADSPARLPTQIGPYVVDEKLGSGGMGTVFRATHSKLKRTVALKVLPAQRWSNTAAIARFQREMEAIGQLDHPHIVRASDAGEDNDMHYLVMEFIDGMDLGRLARCLGPLPVAEACELARQAAIGLQHAHDAGLVHRDVKPSNLMLAWDRSVVGPSASASPGPSDPAQLKLLDLGLALLGDEHLREQHDVTTVGTLMGTLDYMSPEQGIDSHAVDHRADIYGLGATLFKLLTGRAPYADPQYDSLMKKMTALATKPAPSVGKIRAELPSPVVQIVDRMLARDPDERFSSAQEVAEALAEPAQRADLGSLLRRGIEAEESSETMDTPTPLVASPLIQLNSAVATTPSNRQPTPSAHPTSGRGRRIRRWLLAAAAGFLLIAAGIVWRISTDYGQIVVESDDPNAELVIKKLTDGKVAKTLQLEQGQGRASVRTGEYLIEIVGDATSLKVEPAQGQVDRQGELAVTVRRTGPNADSEPAASPTTREPVASKLAPVQISAELPDRFSRGTSHAIRVTIMNTGAGTLTNARASFLADNNLRSNAEKSSPGSIFFENSLQWTLNSIPPGKTKTFVACVDLLDTAPLANTLSTVSFFCDQGTSEEHLEAPIVADPRQAISAMQEQAKRMFAEIEAQFPEDAKSLVYWHNGSEVRLNGRVREESLGPIQQIAQKYFPDIKLDGLTVGIAKRSPVHAARDQEEGPVYNGKTLREWLWDTRSERNSTKLAEAIQAVNAMIGDDVNRGLVDESMDSIFRMVRTFGKRHDAPGNALINELAWMTLVRMPHEQLLKRVIQEVREGTQASRDFLTYFLYPTRSVEIDDFDQDPWDEARMFLAKLRASAEFTKTVAQAEDRAWSTDFLFYFCEESTFAQQYPQQFSQQSRFDGDVAFFQQSLKTFCDRQEHLSGATQAAANPLDSQQIPDWHLASMAAMRLAEIAPDTEELVLRIQTLLELESSTSAMELSLVNIFCVRALERLGSQAAPCTRQLIELLEHRQVFVEGQHTFFSMHNKVPGNRAGVDQELLARSIVRALGNIGPAATAAVPYLEKIHGGRADELIPAELVKEQKERAKQGSFGSVLALTPPNSSLIRQLAKEALLKIDPDWSPPTTPIGE